MVEKLDSKDKKLLLAMDMSARQTDSSIAKIVGLSKQLANYRIRRLEKQEIIKSYYPVIDHTKLGLQLYRIAIKLGNATKEKEQEIINYLEDKSSWIVSVLGEYDIWMAIYAKNEFEFMKQWNKFYEKYGYYVESRWISLMTNFSIFERSFIYPKSKNRDRKFVLGEDPGFIKLDKVDLKIVRELTKDSRQSSLEISKKIGQTERITRYRIKKLEEKKVILGYRPFINTSKLDLKYYKLFIGLKDTKKRDLSRISTYIKHNPNVVYSTYALGGYDFEIEVQFHNSNELVEFITKLKEIFPTNIRNISHMEYIKEFKITYYPIADE
jgi:DNA-binding Lrp family transcriptional regulator|tara:strand:- start:157 stop:1131 length:975 start_codon:yes stop_codon:yes gene_type:complete